MPIVDSALKYINKGLSIIPLKGKVPLVAEWKQHQSRIPTELEVAAWYRRWPDAGIGVICGAISNNLAVFDIDDLSFIARLLDSLDDLPTLAVMTASGRLHLYLRESRGNSRNERWDGPNGHIADLKAEGGYVVAPPSIIGEARYRPINNKEILTVPSAREWIVKFFEQWNVEIVKETDREKKYEVLKQRKLGIGERDDVFFRYACKLWHEGWAKEELMAILLSLNKTRCVPPMEDAQVEKIVDSASSYSRDANPVIEDLRGLFPIYPGNMLKPLPKSFVIDGIVPEGYITLIYGDGGHGKSWLTTAIAIHVAIGEPIFLRGVRQTNVLYLDWELDPDEFTLRAYRVSEGLGMSTPPKKGLCYMRMEQPLSHVLPAIKSFIVENKIGLLFIDSLGMAGVRDINSPANAIEFFEKLRSLNTTIIAVDHQSKLQKDQAYSTQTPIGTVYKFNLSRSVLQMQKTGWKSGQLDVKLEHKKMTFGSLCRDINFSILYDGFAGKVTFLPYTADAKDD